jgi:WD40 repeat protein
MIRKLACITALWPFSLVSISSVASVDENGSSQLSSLTSKVEWGKTGQYIVVGTWENGLTIYETTSQNPLRHIPYSETGVIVDLALSPDEQVIALVHDNSVITLWDIHTAQQLSRLESGAVGINRITWNPDGNFLASSSAGDSHVWDLSTREILFSMASGEEFPIIGFSSDGRLVRSSAQQIQIWDVASQQLMQRMQVVGLRSSVQWSEDNTRLLVSNISLRPEGAFYSIQILNTETWEVLQEFEEFPAQITSAA